MKNSKKEIIYYIALNDNDSWSGRSSEPNENNTDGPFATLVKARDSIRELRNLKADCKPVDLENARVAKPIRVLVRAGLPD